MDVPVPKGRFVPGDPRRGTKPKGTRNKVATSFFNDLYAVWNEQGEAVLRRAAFEKPMEFAAMVAKLMPAKLEISTPTHGLTDERFQELMDLAERQLALSAEGAGASAPAASMTIEGSAVSLEGGGGSPQVGLIAGEVIDVASSSGSLPKPLLATTAPEPDIDSLDPITPDSRPDFAAAPYTTPSSNPATMPAPLSDLDPEDDDIDIASLF